MVVARNQGYLERSRRTSASEPLLPETIEFIKENLIQSNYHFELPHVFVVFGASVGIFLNKTIF